LALDTKVFSDFLACLLTQVHVLPLISIGFCSERGEVVRCVLSDELLVFHRRVQESYMCVFHVIFFENLCLVLYSVQLDA